MKTAGILASIIVLINISLSAQNLTEDYEITGFYIYVNTLTPLAIKTINNTKGKERMIFSFRKPASQLDFDKACQEFSWIQKLTISSLNNRITDISAVSNLKSLNSFQATSIKASKENPIDLAPLGRLKKLKILNLKFTEVTNTEALAGLEELQQVNFQKSKINSLSFMCSTPKLRFVYLNGSNHTFENYESLACLKDLSGLKINNNPQATDANLAILRPLEKLNRVRFKNNKEITSLSFLEGNENMHEIIASGCTNLRDVSALSTMKKLTYVDFDDTQVKSLEMLDGITTLVHIDISNTAINDISFLENCESLIAVNVSKTLVKDISPIYNCKRLSTVTISSTIQDLEKAIEQLKSINPKVNVFIKE